MINSKTELLLQSFTKKPSSSLIIEGDAASGAENAINTVSKALLGDTYSGNKIVLSSEDEKSIGIEVVRELKQKLSTVSGNDQPITRIALIVDAHKLTTEAQNGLLKILEEPVTNTLIILQTSKRTDLLETIQSRCQIIPLLPISKKDTDRYCEDNDLDPEVCNRAYHLSEGKSLLFEQLANREESTLIDKVTEAKKFYAQSAFDRLKQQKTYSKPEELRDLISNMITIASAGLHSGESPNSIRWQKTLSELRKLEDMLTFNVNTKLIFLRLSVMV